MFCVYFADPFHWQRLGKKWPTPGNTTDHRTRHREALEATRASVCIHPPTSQRRNKTLHAKPRRRPKAVKPDTKHVGEGGREGAYHFCVKHHRRILPSRYFLLRRSRLEQIFGFRHRRQQIGENGGEPGVLITNGDSTKKTNGARSWLVTYIPSQTE